MPILCGCGRGVDEEALLAENRALLRGYTTLCHGKLFISSEEGDSLTEFSALAGPLEVVVVHEGDPVPQPGAIGNYFCSDLSRHRVRFDARPGKAYRFSVIEVEPRNYRVVAYEYLDPPAPEGRAVETFSEQIEIDSQCRFYPQWAGCFSFGRSPIHEPARAPVVIRASTSGVSAVAEYVIPRGICHPPRNMSSRAEYVIPNEVRDLT